MLGEMYYFLHSLTFSLCFSFFDNLFIFQASKKNILYDILPYFNCFRNFYFSSFYAGHIYNRSTELKRFMLQNIQLIINE